MMIKNKGDCREAVSFFVAEKATARMHARGACAGDSLPISGSV